MRAVSLHPDVIVVTSAVLHVNCVIVRGAVGEAGAGTSGGGETGTAAGSRLSGETFVIDSPVLPDELDALPTLLAQAQFPPPSGLLATHGDWDHLLGRLAFPGVALGCCDSTAERLRAAPGEAQRELRSFDEDLLIQRQHPLALGEVQTLPVPGRCDIGESELELHPATGHTVDGMAILVPWANVLAAGDYLSTRELPAVHDGGDAAAYAGTLERLRPLVAVTEHVVPGHGPVLDRARAHALLDEDLDYVRSLVEHGADARAPARCQSRAQRATHMQNVARIAR
jgi:glyoxylase-like metal-dependent hydrolase (beta-lactamase superfamily II)